MKNRPRRPNKAAAAKPKYQKLNGGFLPILATLIICAVLYFVFLLPASPAKEFKQAGISTIEQVSSKGFRYNGSFGISEQNIKAEYSGQKSSTGDLSMVVSVSDADESSFSIEFESVAEYGYIKLTSVENFRKIASTVPGMGESIDKLADVIAGYDGKWVRLSKEQTTLVTGASSCNDLSIPNVDREAMESDWPLSVVGGPYSTGDGTSDQKYDISIDWSRTDSEIVKTAQSFSECIDGLINDDQRLRERSDQELSAMKYEVTVSKLSNTIRRISYKQFGDYFVMNLTDIGKDINVTAPEDYEELTISDISQLF